MPLNPIEWHSRFLQQAAWTRNVRTYLLQRADIAPGKVILEAGCGTGAVLSEISRNFNVTTIGVDIEIEYINLATIPDNISLLINADGYQLPLEDNCIDISYCHYLLLWLNFPANLLKELVRVTKPGGAVIAMAEPDYGGRIDFPEILSQLGVWQSDALVHQGADPKTGRKLAQLFTDSGVTDIEVGVLGGQWGTHPNPADLVLEWKILESDLMDQVSGKVLGEMKEIDQKAWASGSRILYVPTFYASGRVPQ